MKGTRQDDPIPGLISSNWYQIYRRLGIYYDNPEILGPLINRTSERIALGVRDQKLINNNQLFRWFFLCVKYQGMYFARWCPMGIIEKIAGFLYDRNYYQMNPGAHGYFWDMTKYMI